MNRLAVLLVLILASLPVAGTPAPNQAMLLLDLEGEWDITFPVDRPEQFPGERHRFQPKGRGEVYQGYWWDTFTWERRSNLIVVRYEGGLVVQFALSMQGSCLEGRATSSMDGDVVFLPRAVRFARHRS